MMSERTEVAGGRMIMGTKGLVDCIPQRSDVGAKLDVRGGVVVKTKTSEFGAIHWD
ncbi:hypothetical protein [Chelativorans alearense]|uniref:hypothetical protein n=1 Tax=Chelativorans alearense TaxID=2681495 RepID=UPI00196A0102|nr:hypothetical protein [Chelativorans alearense]